MSYLIHNFAARKRKRDVSFERAADAIPRVAEGSGRSPSNEGSEVPTIVISSFPEVGLNDQSALENVALAESKEALPAPIMIQVVHPPEQPTGKSDKAKYTRAGRRRPLLPNQMLMNLYLPPHGPTPPMEEVLVLGSEGAQEIIDQWRPFNRGESSADRLHELYPVMLRMPVVVRARGQGEKYSISVPSGTIKEDI